MVFDDGSKDSTPVILESYKPRITVFRDSNHGLSYVRNYMGHRARCDILAFLDADDTWHPRYLETQKKMIEKHPGAVAWFAEHEDLVGWGEFKWPEAVDFQAVPAEVIQPLDLLIRSNQTPLVFQMSGCCVPKHVFAQLGPEPFKVNGAEDTYFNALLALLGPVAHTTAKPVAYRVIEGSASANRLKGSLDVLAAFEALEGIYKKKANAEMYRKFGDIHAARRRNCGKFLMGSGRVPDARAQFMASLKDNGDRSSLLKSLALLSASFLPKSLQPKWNRPLRRVQQAQ
jgi:glycosyltransferase involved in cell wall biosynthesis